MRTLALTTAAILIATTAMADVTCDLIFVPNPKLPRDCLELQAIPENVAARCTYCSIAMRTAHTTDAALAVRRLRNANRWGCRW
jgi:hypothetical protein